MADEKDNSALWRLFQRLEHGIGGIVIHIIDRIDDGDAKGCGGRRAGEKLR